MDVRDLLDSFLSFLEANRIPYCVIGGQAVNAYVEPLVSLDLDVAVGVEDPRQLRILLGTAFTVNDFPHGLSVIRPDSDLRVQVRTDRRYADFVPRSLEREVLGRRMKVAAIADVLQGKIWAASDPERRGSKRQKDLADISRILESCPDLRAGVPAEILARLV